VNLPTTNVKTDGQSGSPPSRAGRKVTLRARAVRQEETRERIVSATVDLHESVGPLATTISAIAERAGVQRLTVYRHFPTEELLFAACTNHHFGLHPPPDLTSWAGIADPMERSETGLRDLYRFWADIDQMAASVLRDHEVAPDRVGGGLITFMHAAADLLTAPWPSEGERFVLRGVMGHLVHFRTWQTLVRDQGLDLDEALAASLAMVTHAARIEAATPRTGPAR
jgi:AcrR family transcriptional regulator